MKMNSIIEGKVECNPIIKNIIIKNNSTDIDDEYLNSIIIQVKEMKIDKCVNINYYWRRKESDKLIREINNKRVWSGSRIENLQEDMKMISMCMYYYL